MQEHQKSKLAFILRTARLDIKKSQEIMAEEAGVSIQTVRRAETTGNISGESLRCLCAVLSLDCKDVLSRCNTKESDLNDIEEKCNWKVHPQYKLFNKLHTLNPYIYLVCFCLFVFTMIPYSPPPIGLQNDIFVIKLMFCIIYSTGCSFHMFTFPLCLISWPSHLHSLKKNGLPIGAVNTVWGKLCVMNSIACLPFYIAFFIGRFMYPDSEKIFYLIFYGTGAQFMFNEIALFMARKHEWKMGLILDQKKTCLPDIRAMFSRSGRDSMDEALPKLRRLLELCVMSGRTADGEPIAWLIEDVQRGISGKKALDDYLRIAEIGLNQPTGFRPQRLEAEISIAKTRLQERISLVG